MHGRVARGRSRADFPRRLPAVFQGFLPGAALLLGVALLSSCGQPAESSNRIAQPSERIFSTARPVPVSIEMDPDDLEVLRREGRSFAVLAEGCSDGPSIYEYTDFMATATVDGERLQRIGIRKKGYIGSLSKTRPSIKLRFNQFVQGQHIDGVRRLTLNNNRQDPSNVFQCIAYGIFSAAGVPASVCGFAELTINGEDMGVYTTLESYDRTFLARHFASGDGKLYEGQLADFRMNWVETFENKLQDTYDDRHELYELTRALRADDEDLLELVEPLIDLDAYISFWATESLIGHWDGYNGNQNNFFLYLEPTSRKFHFIPWGTDGAFATSPLVVGVPPLAVSAFGMLPYRLYGLPEIRARYFDRLRELLDTVWNEEALLAEIDSYAAVLSPNADEAWLEILRTFVRDRRGAIEAELAMGEPVWDLPLNPDERCFTTQPEIHLTFSTTFGTADAFIPFGQGEASLSMTIDGEEQVFTTLASTAGSVPDLIGLTRPTINVFGLRADGSLLVVNLTFEDFEFVPGSPEFHGAATLGAVAELVNGVPVLLGVLSAGTIILEAASAEEGAPVRGEVTSVWFKQ